MDELKIANSANTNDARAVAEAIEPWCKKRLSEIQPDVVWRHLTLSIGDSFDVEGKPARSLILHIEISRPYDKDDKEIGSRCDEWMLDTFEDPNVSFIVFLDVLLVKLLGQIGCDPHTVKEWTRRSDLLGSIDGKGNAIHKCPACACRVFPAKALSEPTWCGGCQRTVSVVNSKVRVHDKKARPLPPWIT